MKLLNFFTFTIILNITSFMLLANNNANENINGNKVLHFEIANKSTQYSFSANDARQLEKYLLKSNSITHCDQENLVVNLTSKTGQQNIVQELYTVGYAVLELSCSQQKIVITLSKTPADLAMLKTHFQKQERLAKAKLLEKENSIINESKHNSNADCNDCGAVSLNQNILDELKKDAVYDEQLIDFGSTETTDEQVANMESENSIFSVESDNIVCNECDASLLTEELLDEAIAKLKNINNNELAEDASKLELQNSSAYKDSDKVTNP
ncbi:MAG: hypothetical protein ACPG5B_00905 [Chitinophagales bacterium]